MKREMGMKAYTERKQLSKTKAIINKHTLYGISFIYFFDFIEHNVSWQIKKCNE